MNTLLTLAMTLSVAACHSETPGPKTESMPSPRTHTVYLREQVLPEAINIGYAAGGGALKTVPLRIDHSVRIRIPGGVFWKGSTEEEIDERVRWFERWVAPAVGPADRVRYEDEVLRPVRVATFTMDRTEVTIEQFERFAKSSGYRPLGTIRGGAADHPVTGVTLADAMAYCAAVGARLPTADEWEYAARGPESRRFPWGAGAPDGALANFCDASCERPWGTPEYDDGHQGSAPVGSYPSGATPLGLLDMAGNAREWVGSLVDGEHAQVKGGGFVNAYDDLIPADVRQNFWWDTGGIGFRCAAASGPVARAVVGKTPPPPAGSPCPGEGGFPLILVAGDRGSVGEWPCGVEFDGRAENFKDLLEATRRRTGAQRVGILAMGSGAGLIHHAMARYELYDAVDAVAYLDGDFQTATLDPLDAPHALESVPDHGRRGHVRYLCLGSTPPEESAGWMLDGGWNLYWPGLTAPDALTDGDLVRLLARYFSLRTPAESPNPDRTGNLRPGKPDPLHKK